MAILVVVCALVATLTWLSYRYGRITILKEQATETIKVKQEADNELEKLKELPVAELDTRLSEWVRDNK